MGLSEARYRQRCIAAGALAGTVEGLGIGALLWGNPYIGLALALGALVLLLTAKTAARERDRA